MTTVRDIANALEKLFPLEYALPDDPTGPQVGRLSARVGSVLVALDPDLDALRAAARLGATHRVATHRVATHRVATVLVTHHPLWWKPPRGVPPRGAPPRGAPLRGAPPRRVTDDRPAARVLIEAAERGIAILAAHTNADFAPGGLCDALARDLLLRDPAPLLRQGTIPVGRVGLLAAPTSWSAYRAHLKRLFGAGLRLAGAPPRSIRRVAVCSGSGADLLPAAVAAGADLLVTGDVKYHAARDAATHPGFAIIDAGHFETERLFIPLVVKALRRRFPGLRFQGHRPHPPFRLG